MSPNGLMIRVANDCILLESQVLVDLFNAG